MTYRVVCSRCGRPLAASAQPECPQGCGRPIIEYDVSPAALACLRPQGGALAQSLARFWRYAPLLPLNEGAAMVSLGEGATPLVDCPHAGQELSADRLYVKLEAANPTGSFKDRCAAVAIAKSLELGRPAVAIASAGNAAAAASAYAARAGVPCWVFVPDTTPPERLVQTLLAGARVVAVKGGSVNDCSDLVSAGAERYGWYPVTTAAIHNLYQAEATRTIAFEIWEQSQYAVPDWIVAPVGGGGLLSGIARGWRELRDYGLTDRIPRLVAVQPDGCAPLVRAALAGTAPDEIAAWGRPTSVATSIADPFPMDGARALEALRLHGGQAVMASDPQILAAEAMLAAQEGLFIEPASATAVAGAGILYASGALQHDESVVVIASGTGFKDVRSALSLIPEVPRIALSVEEMMRAVEKLGA